MLQNDFCYKNVKNAGVTLRQILDSITFIFKATRDMEPLVLQGL